MGLLEGFDVGVTLGLAIGLREGATVVGVAMGLLEGLAEGNALGARVGTREGKSVNGVNGCLVGTGVGDADGRRGPVRHLNAPTTSSNTPLKSAVL
jgi:hypothetical protein